MATIMSGLGQSGDDNEPQQGYRENGLNYRHWFVISLLLLFNVVIFGCIFLAVLGRIRLGF